MRSLARLAEDLGYAELYSSDHLGAADPFIPLIVAAEATSHLRIGTLVLNNEFHHPALLARTVATADEMTGGRVVLGIGTGYARAEHDAMGMELRRRGPRVDRLEESVQALRSLLDEGSVEMHGDHHRLTIEDIGVRPVQAHVPLLIGGHGRRVVGVAARWADIFQFTGLTHAHDGTPRPGGFALEALVERSRWLSEDAGQRDEAIERSIFVQGIALGSEAESARDRTGRRLGLDRSVVETTPFLLFGSVSEVIDRLEEYRDLLGVNHVVVRDAQVFSPVVSALAGR
jgi:probable F420-dependent oxidoreductase